MKTIRCNLTKTCRMFATFTESLIKCMATLPEKNQEISQFIEEIYARLYYCYVQSIEFVSILK